MENTQFMRYMEAVVNTEYNDAVTAFQKSPSADNWKKLKRAMYVYQGFRPGGILGTADKAHIMSEVPIPKWYEALFAAVIGDADENTAYS